MQRFLLQIVVLTIIVATAGCEYHPGTHKIGVLQWTEEIEPYVLSYQGLLDSLNDKGYLENLNVSIDYRNVSQDKNQALAAARSFVNNDVDLIVALGTGSALAALEATKISRTPIVFSIAGAPKVTGIIDDFSDSGKNITGVSMHIPLHEQFTLIKEILPDIQTLGIIYCSEMSQAVATGREAAAEAPSFGWRQQTTALPLDDLPNLAQRVRTLAATVDALYIPTDPILTRPQHLATIVQIADELSVPVIGVAKHFVKSGLLASVHCDFYELGRQAGGPIDLVLQGVDTRTIPTQRPLVKKVSLNLNKARKLGIEINRNTILKTDNLFE